ncbi:unnamed protein product [Closterium sp. NIES-65]|nr:unnamed protein product [Closterium sp. NIES-65]
MSLAAPTLQPLAPRFLRRSLRVLPPSALRGRPLTLPPSYARGSSSRLAHYLSSRAELSATSVSAEAAPAGVSADGTSAEAEQLRSSGAGESGKTPKAGTLTFQDAIQRLQEYWAGVGCAVLQPSSTEVGAGTMNPATFLRVLGPEAWRVAYVEPSMRPDDSRFGDNPNRVQRHTQFQVLCGGIALRCSAVALLSGALRWHCSQVLCGGIALRCSAVALLSGALRWHCSQVLCGGIALSCPQHIPHCIAPTKAASGTTPPTLCLPVPSPLSPQAILKPDPGNLQELYLVSLAALGIDSRPALSSHPPPLLPPYHPAGHGHPEARPRQRVILKPDPGNAQELYLGSLAALGIDSKQHDVRFVEDNWESPVLGAWGLGWEVWLDGMEITQFTYFQQVQCGAVRLGWVGVERERLEWVWRTTGSRPCSAPGVRAGRWVGAGREWLGWVWRESPVLGAWGLGWEVWLDGMEITQFTYFQQVQCGCDGCGVVVLDVFNELAPLLHIGGMPLSPVSVEITYGLERIIMSLQVRALWHAGVPVEITYGLERIIMSLQGVDHLKHIAYAPHLNQHALPASHTPPGVDHFKRIAYAPGVTYGELFLENEREMSCFNMEEADTERVKQRFDLYDAEAQALIDKQLAIPAFDHVLKTSHAFNILDARGAVGVTERARFFGRMRRCVQCGAVRLARQCAQLWVDTREKLGFPLGRADADVAQPTGDTWPSADVAAQDGAASAGGVEAREGEGRMLVVEIGTEELPPDDVSSAVAQVGALGAHWGAGCHLSVPPISPTYQSHLSVPPVSPTYQSHPPTYQSHLSVPPISPTYQSHPPISPTYQSHLSVPPISSNHLSVPPTYQSHPPISPTYQSHPPISPTHLSVPPTYQSHLSVPPTYQSHLSVPPISPTYQSHPPISPTYQSHLSVPTTYQSHPPISPTYQSHLSVPPISPTHLSVPPISPTYQSHLSVRPISPTYQSHLSVPPVSPTCHSRFPLCQLLAAIPPLLTRLWLPYDSVQAEGTLRRVAVQVCPFSSLPCPFPIPPTPCCQLQAAIPPLLTRLRLPYSSVRVEGTPRRVAVQVAGLAAWQQREQREVRGPPANKAFDKDGKPTKALEGFCKRNAVTAEAVTTREDDKGVEYVWASVSEESRPAWAVLGEQLPAVIAGIAFPKTMRWNSQVAFSRPIRWLLAMHGHTVVPFAYAGLASGNESWLLRNAPETRVQLPSAEEYAAAIAAADITLSIQERKDAIWAASNELAASVGGSIPEDARGDLLAEVANLVESPVPLLGSFDRSFLDLPPEVLVMVMRKHQRYFPVQDAASGKLLPYFVAVPNGRLDEAAVRAGNESVLRARYEDARFFFNSDTAHPLESFREKLKGITFQAKLGSMLDKSERIEAITPLLCTALHLSPSDFAAAQQAARLCMADLGTAVVMEFTGLAGIMGRHYAEREGLGEELCMADLGSGVVMEFTGLAGIMGRHYAEREGLGEAVSRAIFECVLPRSAGDQLPTTAPGLMLSLATRLDSLVGLFAIGCEPSASADPFGLRRSAYGLVEALVASNTDLHLSTALQAAASVQPVEVTPATLEQVSCLPACVHSHLHLSTALQAAAPVQPVQSPPPHWSSPRPGNARAGEVVWWLASVDAQQHPPPLPGGPWGCSGGGAWGASKSLPGLQVESFIVRRLEQFLVDRGAAVEAVESFIVRRLEQFLVDRGAAVEAVRSVLEERGSVPALGARSVAEMEELQASGQLEKIVAAYARPTRIVRGKDVDLDWQVREKLFESDAERTLWDAFKHVDAEVSTDMSIKAFADASMALVDPLEGFFANVFVMAEEEQLRKNRLGLLSRIARLPEGIADLTVLPGF